MSNVRTIQEIYAAFGRGDVWRFDAEGRVVGHRHGVDTHLHQLAWEGDSGV